MIRVRICLLGDEKAVFGLAKDFAMSFAVDPIGFSGAFSQVFATPDMYCAVAESEGVLIGYVLGTSHPTFYASLLLGWRKSW